MSIHLGIYLLVYSGLFYLGSGSGDTTLVIIVVIMGVHLLAILRSMLDQLKAIAERLERQ